MALENKYKKYKNRKPLETIELVRGQLKNWNLLLKENSNNYHDFYSCRLTIADSDLSVFNIGTNGKGRSFSYSLASGYAEFMERIQNRLLFDSNIIREIYDIFANETKSEFLSRAISNNIKWSFLYDPNEYFSPCISVLNQLHNSGVKLFSNDKSTNEKLLNIFKNSIQQSEVLLIPFYDVSQDKEIFLPFDLCLCTTGSNGMCAGNTKEEAFLQGVCEIFERYSAMNIFFKKLTPPMIPAHLFKNTVAGNMYKFLSLHGFEIKIIDCSLGKGLPVIGTIIVNKSQNLYNVKFGSDFVPHIALERCLTETFQSIEGFNGLSIDNHWADEDYYTESKDLFNNFNNIIANGSGIWPSSMFDDKASYSFNGFPTDYGISDKSDVMIAKKLVENLGFKMYIRDNSASNIPALYIYIPGMSSSFCNAEHFEYNIGMLLSPSLGRLNNIGDLDTRELGELYNYLKNLDSDVLSKIDMSKFAKYDKYSDMFLLDIKQLLFMLSYKAKDYPNSMLYLSELARKQFSTSLYFSLARKYVYLKCKKGKTDKQIKSFLQTLYKQEYIDEVVSDFCNPGKIFKDHYLSHEIKKMNNSHLDGLLKIAEIYNNLNKSYLDMNISQTNLRSFFN